MNAAAAARTTSRRDRVRAALAVGVLHLAIGWALVLGLAWRSAVPEETRLKVFEVGVEPPPPERLAEAAEAEGAAAPPALEARPAPVVAAKTPLPVRSPLPAVAEPLPGPTGRDPTAGAADLPGPGTGAGGEGSGSGSGAGGSGTGGGGSRAVRISGRLVGATDYPRAALRAGVEGSVGVRFVVGVDGRVTGCTVTRSSGSIELDSTTCRVIEERFRYRPARNAAGEPVPQTVATIFDWSVPGRVRR